MIRSECFLVFFSGIGSKNAWLSKRDKALKSRLCSKGVRINSRV
nr:MAG TPA: hypothetical protein [Caudoviricetes sp.]